MLFPIGDDNSDRTSLPVINYCLILLNIFVFVFLQEMGKNENFTYSYSTVPEEIITGKDIVTQDRTIRDTETHNQYTIPGLKQTPINVYLTLLTSIFMHGSIAHIFGNMIFLWVFGDNIENRLGHLRYLFFYLLCGILASLSHVIVTTLFEENQLVPTLGASGAISGVLGAYIVLFPKRRVRVILLNFLTVVPAYMALGIWFIFQVISGLGVLGSQQGGVAYAAHVGGFIAGIILILIFTQGRKH